MNMREIRKNSITEAARELFSEFGYKSVSMDQIAAKANIAKGTLYLYFKSKDDLFNSLAQEFIYSIKEFIDKIEEKHLSLLEEIHEVIYTLLIYRKNQKFLYKIAQEAKEMRTPSAREAVRMIDDEILNYIDKRLKAAVDQKIIKPVNTSVTAFVVLKVYSALAFEWEEEHTALNEKEIAESVSSFFKGGLLYETCGKN
jgi:AcrR family transcriptional regulator